jgi:signal peptidase I
MRPSPSEFNNAHALKCEMASEVLRSSGTLRLRVTGWSMLPTIWPGDTLVVESVTSDAVNEGDIVLFGRDRRLFAHRVVQNIYGGFAEILTRGDAMPKPDPPVCETELLGKVRYIVRNGKSFEPGRSLGLTDRAVAALVRSSEMAARAVVGVRGKSQTSS